MENDEQRRHVNSIDTVSLLPGDAAVPPPDEEVEGNITFQELVRGLTSNEQKVIALALFIGFNKSETAIMLKVDPSRVILIIRDMRKELLPFYR
jgi:DNA-directed RNA polymerase specialized sigma24 family protein